MQIKLYNTLSKSIETFKPINDKCVKMYVCGPTVYDFVHIGNARSVIIYDLLYRLLTNIYGENHVLYVRNITDVDDKIQARAKELKCPITEITRKTTYDFWSDMRYLNCLTPNIEPKATEHINEMISMIEKLLNSGYAYIHNNTVYFDITKFSHYGQLAGRNLDTMLSGVRIEVDTSKQHPGDFVLWKPGMADDDLSALFESPWGLGQPGWHIECSAMSHKYLGENFDIHGGGVDLIFPHHSNEIAQSKCAYPQSQHAKFWVHNGFLTVNNEKMSKSLGNFITVHDLIEKNIPGETIRYLLLSADYKKPLNYNEKALQDSITTMNYLYRSITCLDNNINSIGTTNKSDMADFLEILYDDMNTMRAFAYLHNIAKEINNAHNQDTQYLLADKLKQCANLLGLLTKTSAQWFDADLDMKLEQWILSKIDSRNRAKDAKNYTLADQIRKELGAKNIRIEDSHNGTKYFKT